MVRMLTRLTVAVLVGLLASACLLRETSETWYVAANGEVHWVVTEKDVRSDAKTLPDRQDEESGYWLAVQQERHPYTISFASGGRSRAGRQSRSRSAQTHQHAHTNFLYRCKNRHERLPYPLQR